MKIEKLIGTDLEDVLSKVYDLTEGYYSYNLIQLPKMITHIIIHGRTKTTVGRIKGCLHRIETIDLPLKEMSEEERKVHQDIVTLLKENHQLFRIPNETDKE